MDNKAIPNSKQVSPEAYCSRECLRPPRTFLMTKVASRDMCHRAWKHPHILCTAALELSVPSAGIPWVCHHAQFIQLLRVEPRASLMLDKHSVN